MDTDAPILLDISEACVAPTLHKVLSARSLGLVQRAGPDRLTEPVRWVHATELLDPTAYLEGGELLLTTGMRLGRNGGGARGYAERLVAAGVVALGFGVGVGLTYASIPKSLITACDDVGLPLFEVPQDTPFIQVTKAVSDLIAAEEREQLSRSLDAQRSLTRAALGPDRAAGVLSRLAREVGGWAMLVNARGDIVHASPSTAKQRHAEVAAEVERLRPKGVHAGSSSTAGGERLVVQPLGVDGRPRAYLAVGAPDPWLPGTSGTVSIAVSLLSLEGERGSHDVELQRSVRTACVRLALRGHADDLPLDELGWGWLHHGPLLVVVLTGPAPLLDEGCAQISDAVPDAMVARLDDLVVAVVATQEALAQVGLILAERGRLRAGLAEVETLAALSDAARHAHQAAAASAPGHLTRYDELAGVGLMGLVNADAADGFADAALAPLESASAGADLVASLDAWLGKHGQWDAAAQVLGVHRHTLRHRIRKIEQLLGRSLDDPAVRMELWFALRRREEHAPQSAPDGR